MSQCVPGRVPKGIQCALLVILLSLVQASATGGARQLAARDLRITSVTLSPDGKTFVTGSADAFTRLWDVGTGNVLYTVRGRGGGITSVAFSPDGRLVVTGSGRGKLSLINVASGKELLDFGGAAEVAGRSEQPVISLAYSPDGRRVVSGGTDYKVRIWSVETGRQERTLTGHRGPVKSVSFSGDGKLVLTVGGDGRGGSCFKWWNLAAGKEAGEICDVDYLNFVAFMPDGRKVITGGGTELKLWDLNQRKQLIALRHGSYIHCAALSHDGKLALSAGGDGVVKVWDVVAGKLVRKLEGHDKSVFSVSFNSDDRTALSGDGGGIIKLWDLSTGAEIRSFPFARSIASIAPTPLLW